MFMATVCVVSATVVALSAVVLRDRQERNKQLDRRRNVLDVANLVAVDEKLSREQVNERFERSMRAVVIHLSTGAAATDVDPTTYDQRIAAQDASTSRAAPDNPAGVARLPTHAVVYEVIEQGRVRTLILPIEGQGLWSTLYGFIALRADLGEIEGITFYEHRETPGLGGEIDNPRWKSRWVSRRAFDAQWIPQIEVVKGPAGPPTEVPYLVDGLSGATLTGRGVTNLVRFWLGDDGFGPFLTRYRRERGIP